MDTISELPEQLDLQNQTYAHDNTVRDSYAHEECWQSVTELEFYLGKEQ